MNIESRVLVPVDELARNGTFSYGASTAERLEDGELKRSGKKMIKRVKDIIYGLELSLVVPKNTAVISHNNGNAFVQVHGSGGGEFFVMARDPIQGNSIQDVVNGKKPTIDIITGICLYSADSVKAHSLDGDSFSITNPNEQVNKEVSSITVNPSLSVYETESLIRLSQFINIIADRSAHVRRVIANNPKIEYYLYVLDAHSQGYISPELAQQWFSHVDVRNKRLSDLMKKRFKNTMIASEPLKPIQDYVTSHVSSGKTPAIDRAKEILCNSSSLWEEIFAIQEPKAWKELNLLSYAYAYLQAGQVNGIDQPNILVAVENSSESKILALAKEIVPQIKQTNGNEYNIIGLYPHEKILPSGEDAGKTMYYVRNPNGNTTQTARDILKAYKRSGK